MTTPLAPGQHRLVPGGAGADPNAAFRSYATSMIASLRADYEHERQAHVRTAEDLSMRNAVLEAMVAQREAELERHLAPTRCAFCARSSGPWASSSASPPRSSPKTEERVPRLTKEDAVRYRKALAVKNRELEAEVEGLSERLERVLPVLYPHNPQKTLQAGPVFPMPSHGSPTATRDHPPRPHTSSPSAPKRTNPSSATNANPDAHDHQSPPIARPLGGTHTYTNDGVAPTALDDQIDALVFQLEELRIQQRRLERPSEAKQPAPAQQSDSSFGKILLLERECIRLRNAEREAVRKLQDAQTAAREREHSLEAEIERLKQAPSDPPEPHWDRGGEHILDPLDDDDDGEPMELATPLQPTVLLPLPNDPPTVPLPPSPPDDPESEEDGESWRLSPAMPVFELDTAELERIRFSLNAAEIQLREKDAELVQLRAELSVRAGHGGGSDG
ncbi:hypothetical protein OF83DRAFT_730600 [Amylostereum chailletii]|nr:hypothetical protein OF83DRAFT_730600 [Amylostereum chailletii]